MKTIVQFTKLQFLRASSSPKGAIQLASSPFVVGQCCHRITRTGQKGSIWASETIACPSEAATSGLEAVISGVEPITCEAEAIASRPGAIICGADAATSRLEAITIFRFVAYRTDTLEDGNLLTFLLGSPFIADGHTLCRNNERSFDCPRWIFWNFWLS